MGRLHICYLQWRVILDPLSLLLHQSLKTSHAIYYAFNLPRSVELHTNLIPSALSLVFAQTASIPDRHSLDFDRTKHLKWPRE